jgi:hypothetical protein
MAVAVYLVTALLASQPRRDVRRACRPDHAPPNPPRSCGGFRPARWRAARLAELIGAYQQAHKYEKGINRISAGQLYQIARVLGVGIDYFFESIEPGVIRDDELMPQRNSLK